MSELDFKGDWQRIKEKLKERYAILTDEDLEYKEGEEEKFLDRLQARLGKTKAEVKDILRDI